MRDVARGMTGIGVLILFISLVLTASIAAGLILDTTGYLQNTAQATGEESTAEISDRLSVLSVSGEVAETGPDTGEYQIETLRATVYKSPGSSNIDLSEVTLSYFGPDGVVYIMGDGDSVSEADVDTAQFSVEAAKDDDDSIPVLNSRDDRATIAVDLVSESNLNPLTTGDSATVQITTQSGATTTEILNAPTTLTATDDTVSL